MIRIPARLIHHAASGRRGSGACQALNALISLGAVWVMTAVNIRGVRSAGAVQVATTVLKLMPLSNATQITDDERALIKRWVEAGAPD